MTLLTWVLLGIYLMCRGAREAGFWSSDATLEGVLLFLAGLFLVADYIT